MIADVLDSVEWSVRPAGADLPFDVEAPVGWSDRALAIVASRYLRAGRETSVRALLQRVGGALANWVEEQGLSHEEHYGAALMELLLHQRGAFNSPVWFNVGVDGRPQCSACFILRVEDSLASIMDLARTEGLLFQRGSGSGTNLSTLRSSREQLAEGGTASGPVSFMRGYDAFAGVVKSGGRTRRAAKMQILDADHPDVLEFIGCKAHEEQKARALIAAGYSGGIDGEAYASVAFQNANLSVRVPDTFMEAARRGGGWETRVVTTGAVVDRMPAHELLAAMAQGAWACGDPGIQFADTIQRWNPCRAGGVIRASNPCSEFLFLDDTACNLASLNLMKYADERFDAEAFCADVGRLLRAMEAIVDRASYPTPRVEEMCRRYRPLGLGYANLGALLMASGLPYDSDGARAHAAALTALMTGEAYRVSSEMARVRGPFDAFDENRESFLEVLGMHRDALDTIEGAPPQLMAAARAAWDAALAGACKHGVRNAQTTLLAPTGTIAFLMDCDTTGIEPELALVKYKHLVGGGTLRLVNRTLPRALARLGYAEEAMQAIIAHVETAETIEGAPGLREEHLPIFDCAVPPPHGGRCIGTDGHLLMMAAAQPFLSGGISKTVNLPAAATVEDIQGIFQRGWMLGLKSVAVYREGSKGAQPLVQKEHCLIEECGVCE